MGRRARASDTSEGQGGAPYQTVGAAPRGCPNPGRTERFAPTAGNKARRPVRSLAPSKPLTGRASPRRSVCAPGTMSLHSIADYCREGDNHVVPLATQFPEVPVTADWPTIFQPSDQPVAGRGPG